MGPERWTRDAVLDLAAAYRPVCVLAAAADLEVFDALGHDTLSADALADRLHTDPRATTILLDALAAMDLLDKAPHGYTVPPAVADVLTRTGANSVLAITQHNANCMRRWMPLARVVQTGVPGERVPSVRGADADLAAYIQGMDDLNRAVAPDLVGRIPGLRFRHLLDVGGASGTWTIAFLRAALGATATLFDRAQVIPIARARIAQAGLADRVRLVPGDFHTDDLPPGADCVWLGSVVHQNSREQNRRLFAKCWGALDRGGQILIRDAVVDASRTRPVGGALFAVHMLAVTAAGNAFTFAELRDDLQHAGFTGVTLAEQAELMNGLVRASKPTHVDDC